MLDSLQSYCELGFSCHLLKSNSKRPVGSRWQKKKKQTFTELKRAYRAGQNIGVRLGQPSEFEDGSFLIAIDVDVKTGSEGDYKKAVLKVCDFLGVNYESLCDFPIVESGRGGGSMHVYFRSKTIPKTKNIARSDKKISVHMPSVRPNQTEKKLISEGALATDDRIRSAWEVDLMSTGRQAVLPPSIHPDSGNPYRGNGSFAAMLSFDDIPLLKLDDTAKPLKPKKTQKTKVEF